MLKILENKIHINNLNIDSNEHYLSSLLFEDSNLDDMIKFGENGFELESEFIYPVKDKINTMVKTINFYPGLKESNTFKSLLVSLPSESDIGERKDKQVYSLEKQILFDDICIISKEKLRRSETDNDNNDSPTLFQEQSFWKAIIPTLIPIPPSDENEKLNYDFVFMAKPMKIDTNGIGKLGDNSSVKIINMNALDPAIREVCINWFNNFGDSSKRYIAGIINHLLTSNYESYKNIINSLSEEEKENFNKLVKLYFNEMTEE